MGTRFHLAIPAGDLDMAIKFIAMLGCERGNAEFNTLMHGQILIFGETS